MKRMKNNTRIISYTFCALALLLSGLSACKKSGTNCISNTGKITRETRIVSEFDSIDLADDVNLILSEDSIFKVEVEAGQNILDGIETMVAERQLIIRNNNICNWIRSYSKPVNVYVSLTKLKKIYYNASGNITTLTPIKSNNLKIFVNGGAGTIDMNLDITGYGYFYLQSGTVDFNLHGKCSISSIYAGDFGLIQAKDLQTVYTYVTNRGSNDVYVNVQEYMEARIESIGNIYYTGNPDSLDIKINGPGAVIPF